eukprot:GILJ01027002.1.p1 GENE.GILJ01027002.1~~GILJ01027002.1.p1  ORF type:complete len:216 (+),score=11.35 GILJ01027002.1:239-886(+)
MKVVRSHLALDLKATWKFIFSKSKQDWVQECLTETMAHVRNILPTCPQTKSPIFIRFNAFEWINKAAPKHLLDHLHVDVHHFNAYKVLPRLLLGEYLSYEFGLLFKEGENANIATSVHLNTEVTDVKPAKEAGTRLHVISSGSPETADIPFDQVVICSGHNWPKSLDAKVPGFYYKPYPTSMLQLHFHDPIALKGSSLTAVDAIRTIARSNETLV